MNCFRKAGIAKRVCETLNDENIATKDVNRTSLLTSLIATERETGERGGDERETEMRETREGDARERRETKERDRREVRDKRETRER